MPFEILQLPFELIVKIFTYTPDLKNLLIETDTQEYDKLHNLIAEIFNYYMNRYELLYSNWKNDPSSLIKKLIENNDIDSLVFLINNFSINYNILFGYLLLYNRKNLYEYFSKKLNTEINYIKLAKDAAEDGNLELFKYASKILNKCYQEFTYFAAKYGKLNIIEYIIENCKENINIEQIAAEASYYGHINIVKAMIEKYHVDNLNEIASSAVEGNHEDILAYVLSRTNHLYEDFLAELAIKAGKKGHYKIVKYLIQLGINDEYYIDIIAFNLAFVGNVNIMEYLYKISNKKINMNDIADNAAYSGNMEVLKWALLNGANNYRNIAFTAIEQCDDEIFTMMLNKIGNSINTSDINSMAEQTAAYDCVSILEILFPYLSDSTLNKIAITASQEDSVKVIEFLNKHKKISDISFICNIARRFESEKVLRFMQKNGYTLCV